MEDDSWYFEDQEDDMSSWSDPPPSTYFDGPNHNPPGIPSTGMEWTCIDGKTKHCPCVCHCSFCNSGINPDRARHRRYYY